MINEYLENKIQGLFDMKEQLFGQSRPIANSSSKNERLPDP